MVILQVIDLCIRDIKYMKRWKLLSLFSYPLLSTGSTQEDWKGHDFDGDIKHPHEQKLFYSFSSVLVYLRTASEGELFYPTMSIFVFVICYVIKHVGVIHLILQSCALGGVLSQRLTGEL